jgi:hypothetical protein
MKQVALCYTFSFNVSVTLSLLAQFFDYTFCTKPPKCILFRPDNPKHPAFRDLDTNIFPIFPIDRSVRIKNFSVRRRQVPMCPAFCLTDYKVQGKTLPMAIVDLGTDGSSRGQNAYRYFCSAYFQLGRPRSWEDLTLLRKVPAKDLSFKPHHKLLSLNDELWRLEYLHGQAKTLPEDDLLLVYNYS